jgi:hypothetical protein
MKVALVNPPGATRAASISAAAIRICRSSSATRARCWRDGHEVLMLDGQLQGLGQ